MTLSKTLRQVGSFASRWRTQRINRRLDDRDHVLAEGVQLLEEWDYASLPVIEAVDGHNEDADAALEIVVHIGGSGLGSSTSGALHVEAAPGQGQDAGQIQFTSRLPGASQDGIQVVFTVQPAANADGPIAAAESIASVVDRTITVELANDSTTTAADVVSLVTNSAEASALVTAAAANGAGAGLVVSAATVELTGGAGEGLSMASLGGFDVLAAGGNSRITATDSANDTISITMGAQDRTAGRSVVLILKPENVQCPPLLLPMPAAHDHDEG